jgi:hypothetical protein
LESFECLPQSTLLWEKIPFILLLYHWNREAAARRVNASPQQKKTPSRKLLERKGFDFFTALFVHQSSHARQHQTFEHFQRRAAAR